MNMIFFSFVLPAYKAKYFVTTINSILSQTYTNFELIIVNDNSPENIEEIVAGYNDKRILYHKNAENIGGKDLVKNWNNCIKYAKGEYLILASDDDIYDSKFLDKIVELIEKYPDVNLFRPRIIQSDDEGNVLAVDGDVKEYTSQLEFTYLLYRDYLCKGIPYYVFKTSMLREIGGFVSFPAAWFSDDATVISMAKNGVAHTQDILFTFRQSSINLSSVQSKDVIEKKIKATSMFYKWIKNYKFTDTEHNKLSEFYLRQINDLMYYKIEIMIRFILSQISIFSSIGYLKKCDCLNIKSKVKLFFSKI